MGIPRDVTPYGSQTVTGPAWPNVEEEQLASAAAQYEAFAAKLTGSVVPQQSSQLMSLMDGWGGLGAMAATGEATSIIGGHEANAAQAAKIALQLHAMEAMVIRTKMLANTTATEVQQECMAIQAMSALISNAQELIESRIKMGLSQNIAYVNANTSEMAAGLGVPPNISNPGAPPGTASTQQAGQKGAEQAMQMLGQLGSMAAQLPGQLAGMVTQAPQQLTQQLSQPLQSLSSMFSGRSGTGVSSSTAPFSSFSNHPAAGGSGAGSGSGLVKAASVPGSGGLSAQTPSMAKLVGATPEAAIPVGAASAGVGGLAPVAAGTGAGGMGMMPHRGEGGGSSTGASLAAPLPLDHDLGEDSDDEW